MTNNPDSKAPERIWASAGSYPKFNDNDWCNASCSDEIEFGVEYTRTDAITPQQAAKVLLESDQTVTDLAIEVMRGREKFGGYKPSLTQALKDLAESSNE